MKTTSPLRNPLTGLLGLLLAVGLVAGGAVGAVAAEEQPVPAPTSDPAPDPSSESSFSLDDQLVAIPNAAPVTTSFRADDIISDKNMYTGTAMSAGAVQSFLQAQVPTCQPGYTCLKDYRTATPSMAGDSRCTAYAGSGSESAATIVARVGQACGISQRALLVLIQKESQLVGDDWPVDKQYQQATGFDCSDSAPCNPAYAGFFKQVYWAAWTLKDYKVDPGSTQYQVGVPVVVKYSDAAGCDGTELTIRTQATASLYNYTPYQPDSDALAGIEGKCASFGNLNFWIIYTDWFGYPHIDVDRIQAPDRYSESVAIAEEAYPDGAKTVYLATGTGYADALSAGPAAVKDHAPLLLTTTDSLPASIAAEFTKLDPDDVVIVGGPNSVGPSVATQLAVLLPGATVTRISGADRFEVSRKVAQRAFGTGATGAYVATGLNFPDALSASGAGGHNGEPVILVNGGAASVDPETAALLTTLKVKNVTIAGGPNSVSTGIQSSIAALPGIQTQRVAGADRFAASLAINKDAYDNTDGTHPSDRVFLATGLNFPDALAGSALAGAQGSPLIVVPGTCVPQDVKLSFAFFDNTKVTLLGGPNSLGAGVESLTSC
ncbi:cell wall-binding repeat-containing protein [Herbiconiux ginsengi]|uniref:Putative cell wall binding repeat 2 n=1 Tax=Herbiconiux ginsengi TaxID=381665 RepID=A0A1H3JJ68_9MICO|nr:cell wall-binding repeat-containing protein [Herbiconiux ginsengi]SDY39609.1 Putative cell wall binding repeat 2 [Herbiconiux ginsengi]